MGIINDIFRQAFGKGRNMFGPIAPKPGQTDAQKIEGGDYDKAYTPGQRTQNQYGEPSNNAEIPDRQKFTIYYSTWVREMTWERYRGKNVVGGGEGSITIEFINGTVCLYKACSYKLFIEFSTAPSKGQFVNAFFRHRPYILVKKGTTKVPYKKPLISEKQYPKGGRSPRNRARF